MGYRNNLLTQWVIMTLCIIHSVSPIHSESIAFRTTNPEEIIAVQSLKLSEMVEGMRIDSYSLVWEDKIRSLGIEDVYTVSKASTTSPSISFREYEGIPNYGVVDSRIWIRTQIRNDTEKRRTIVIKNKYPLIDHLDLFYYQDGEQHSIRSGRLVPHAEQEFRYRGSAFRLTLQPNTTIDLVFRLDSESAMILTPELWSERGFLESLLASEMMQGVFFGAIGIMLAYNIFLFISLRDRGYFYYVTYLFMFGVLFQMSMHGYVGLYILPGSSEMPKYLHNKIYILSVLTVFPLMRYVLRTSEFFPLMDKIYSKMVYVLLLLFVSDFFVKHSTVNSMMDNLSILIILSAIYSCIHIIRRGNTTAYYFLWAFLFVMVGGIVTILRTKGYLPVNFFTENAYQIGMGLEVTLMGFALADRIQIMEREKRDDQAKIRSFHEEMEIARKLQTSTLPSSIPSLSGIQIGLTYKPMSYVGGDFYDFYVMDDGIIILIADVTGHGIPAAFEASMLKVAFSVVKNSGDTPARILESINRILLESYDNQYLTACVVRIRYKDMKLDVANAGHPSILIYRRSEDRFLEYRPKGTIIGLFEKLVIQDLEIHTEPGDRICLFTDGILDGVHPTTQEFYGDTRLKEQIRATQDRKPEDAVQEVLKSCEDWIGKSNPDDDMTLILVDII